MSTASLRSAQKFPRFSFGAVEMSCVDMGAALDAFFAHLAARRGGYIVCTCTHAIVESEHDMRLRRILNQALLTLPDGMPTVWVGRVKGMPVRRVTAADFLEAVLSDPRAKKIRHYFYGGTGETLERIVARASAMVGPKAVVGWSSPPTGAPEDPAALKRIAVTRPDVIWVGLGLPKQEYWMAQYASSFPSSILLGVGAAFDWFAGVQPRAPKWVQWLGLEWLHRVATEPRRLWPRYRDVVPKALKIMFKEFGSTLLHSSRAPRVEGK